MKVTPANNAIDSAKKGKDRRKCKRLSLSFPIEVSGVDPRGVAFRESSVTTDVSEDGCCFNVLRELRCGDVVTIAVNSPAAPAAARIKPVRFEVMWVEASKWGWAIGVGKLQDENVWPMTFPKQKQY